MKQLVILSGKGGTGKTSVSAALAHLCSCEQNTLQPVFVDADVDAANLSLVLESQNSVSHDFWGSSLAVIDPDSCINCEACKQVCRYDAIFPSPTGKPVCWIDPIACDGCAACVYVCPQGSVQMVQQQEGIWLQSNTSFGPLFHAELFPGRENSGKLVTLIKQQARLYALKSKSQIVIIDGPPGIGCPVISACAGVDFALLVTEPGLAGIHDLKRILGTIQHFHIPAAICINKSDIYPQGTIAIREFAAAEGLTLVGEIPYDMNISKAMMNGKPITMTSPQSPAALSIQTIWKRIKELLSIQEEE